MLTRCQAVINTGQIAQTKFWASQEFDSSDVCLANKTKLGAKGSCKSLKQVMIPASTLAILTSLPYSIPWDTVKTKTLSINTTVPTHYYLFPYGIWVKNLQLIMVVYIYIYMYIYLYPTPIPKIFEGPWLMQFCLFHLFIHLFYPFKTEMNRANRPMVMNILDSLKKP